MELDDQLRLKLITNTFHEIESMKGDGSYMDAIITYCEKNDVDIENFGRFIREIPSLKSKIEKEAEDLNYLAKTSRLF